MYKSLSVIGKALFVSAVTVTSLSSCFKEEPLNAECDIESVSFHLENPLGTFFNISDTMQTVASTDSVITFNVRRNHEAALDNLYPQFRLTPGATIVLNDGSVSSDAGGWLGYRVTSEDGNWHRDYRIVITPTLHTVGDTVAYDFEHFELESTERKYYIWHDVLEDGSLGNDWASGNSGFRLSRGTASPEDYPTAPLEEGYDGYGVQLTTRDTGPFGVMANRRIAAGNLFLGSFDLANALTNTLHATRFGIPFDRKPIKVTGYYKYTPGEHFQDANGKYVEGRTDSAAVYAVFYRNENGSNPVMLYGDDVKTNQNIVGIADMGYVKPTEQWTPFEIEFNYTDDVDFDILQNRGYNLTLVFSSSSEGDKFMGAIGSTLKIDKVRVICQKEE